MDCAGMTCASTEAQKRKEAKIGIRTMKTESELMGQEENVQRRTPNVQCRTSEAVRHLYVHIPFCARICPYCAFYKERADNSQTQRFCDAIARELEQHQGKASSQSPRWLGSRLSLPHRLFPSTIYFGGGTPTALPTSQL